MAGDWIKVETTTPDKPEVFRISEELGIDPDAALGKVIRLWIWADQQTYAGNAATVTLALLDRVAGVTGFAKALLVAGWLVQSDHGLVFPNFERHNGQTAKQRGLTAKRVAACKAKKGNAPIVTEALPREEKRRVKTIAPSMTVPPSLVDVSLYCKERQNGIDPQAFLDHYETVGWRYGKGAGKPIRDWKAAVRTWESMRKESQPPQRELPELR